MNTLLKKQAWLLRRETWEHRSFWVTPLVVSSLLLLMTIMGAAAMVSVDDMNMLGNAFDLKMLDSD
ncbi:MAG TPA: hypothetical protein VFP95_02750, partial [Gammaproteobacteria bacterium]|nr:hypothetical protein [Gammaproteobacteria bacterium]